MGSLSRLERRQSRACVACGTLFSASKEQCPSCRTLNIEGIPDMTKDNTILLSEGEHENPNRIQTGPWDEIFGTHREGKKSISGIVDSSVNLLGGAPGAGKSTLALQMADSFAEALGKEVLYIAGEESHMEIKSRAVRLGVKNAKHIRLCPMGVEIKLENVLSQRKPGAVIVDSLPTIMPDPKDAIEFVKRIKQYAILGMPVIIIDHVTKEEEFAGLMELQHQVDGTFLFTVYEDGVRELKGVKNRNGVSPPMLFNMTEKGLVRRSEEEDEEDDEND